MHVPRRLAPAGDEKLKITRRCRRRRQSSLESLLVTTRLKRGPQQHRIIAKLRESAGSERIQVKRCCRRLFKFVQSSSRFSSRELIVDSFWSDNEDAFADTEPYAITPAKKKRGRKQLLCEETSH